MAGGIPRQFELQGLIVASRPEFGMESTFEQSVEERAARFANLTRSIGLAVNCIDTNASNINLSLFCLV